MLNNDPTVGKNCYRRRGELQVVIGHFDECRVEFRRAIFHGGLRFLTPFCPKLTHPIPLADVPIYLASAEPTSEVLNLLSISTLLYWDYSIVKAGTEASSV